MKRALPLAALALLAALPAFASGAGTGVEARITATLDALEHAAGGAPQQIDEAILARPLFVPGRRPEEETGKDPGGLPPAAMPRGLSLKGIVRDGDRIYALVVPPGSRHPRRVREGERLEGWTVVKILPDRLVLGNGQEERPLLLHHYPPVEPAARTPSRTPPARRRKAPPAPPKSNDDHGQRP